MMVKAATDKSNSGLVCTVAVWASKIVQSPSENDTLDKAHFNVEPAIENKVDVKNQTDNHHGIGGYLDDHVVAQRIHQALTAHGH